MLFAGVFLCIACHTAVAGDTTPDYASMVDTRMGTVGKPGPNGLASGFTFLGATYPFGMMQLTPTHFEPQRGIVVNQISGGGCPEMGNFPLIALAGRLDKSPGDMGSFPFYKDILASQAGYLSLEYKDGVKCETTVSKRSGVVRMTFPSSASEGTVIIGSGVCSTKLTNALVKITSPTTLEGYAEGGDFCGYQTDYRVYFVAEFNTPSKVQGTWIRNDMKDGRLTIGGSNSGAYFTFDTSGGRTVEYKVAISYVSIANAHENLQKDNAGRDFDQVLADTRTEWNRHLGKIEVTGDADRMKQFYTHFYHTLIHPNVFNDVNGEYLGADWKVHKTEPGRDHYTTFSGWDTYRTQSQILAVLYPKESSDMMQSLAVLYTTGKRDWSTDAECVPTVRTEHAIALLLDSRLKGIEIPNLAEAYAGMKHEVANLPLKSPDQCMEASTDLWALSRVADLLDKPADAALYRRKGDSLFCTVWDREFRYVDSTYTRMRQNGLYQGTRWQYRWAAPQFLPQMIERVGKDSLEAQLTTFFAQNLYNQGNEPDIHVPYLFNRLGSPEKTQQKKPYLWLGSGCSWCGICIFMGTEGTDDRSDHRSHTGAPF